MMTKIDARSEWWAIRLREYVDRHANYTRTDLCDALEQCFEYIAAVESELYEWQAIDWLDDEDAPAISLARSLHHATDVQVNGVYL